MSKNSVCGFHYYGLHLLRKRRLKKLNCYSFQGGKFRAPMPSRLLVILSSETKWHFFRFQLSMIDVKRKVFVTVTENLNQRRSMCVTERCTYTATTALPPLPNSQKVIDPKHDVTSSQPGMSKYIYSFIFNRNN